VKYIVKTSRVKTGLRMPIELNNKLTMLAEKKECSKNALIIRILWEWVKENEEK